MTWWAERDEIVFNVSCGRIRKHSEWNFMMNVKLIISPTMLASLVAGQYATAD
jgi:hypothetical protein